MQRIRIYQLLVLCAIAGLLSLCCFYSRSSAQGEPSYVGADVCSGCHADVAKKWAFTSHRRTMNNKDASKQGCEACHGPGSEHVAGGGDKTKITRLKNLKPNQSSDICLKCHTQENTTLWHSSMHARSKVTCMNCHDPHSPDAKTLLADSENAKLAVEGISGSIKSAELAAATAAVGSDEKAEANNKVAELKAKKEKLMADLKIAETAYQRAAEPYICYNCHKAQKVQGRQVSHHPIAEGKMKCSSCHNPHGGPKGMLKQESVVETCHRCHAEKVGPFTFEHQPVNEDCTICHSPHGAGHNNLLKQSQPFLCLKCHPMPHSRNKSLEDATGRSIARYMTECTDCHAEIHGSDNYGRFMY